MGRLLCGIRGLLGSLARIAEGDSGAPVARLPHETITAFSPPSSLFVPSGVFLGDRVTGREQSKGVRVGSLIWAGVPICFCGLG